MSCPFLKEGRGRYCHAAPVRKLILEGPGVAEGGRCTSPAYRLCELFREDNPQGERCPHLEEVHVQYCGASPVVRLVPFSESQGSPCTSTGYRYCESYLLLASPNRASEPAPDVLYAPNHFWLEVEESGRCHVGLDAFLAEVVGTVERVTFVVTHGSHRPVLALTVNGIEWPMIFPNPLLIEKVNSHLRGDAERLTGDPYGAGWLFEGWELPGKTRTGLISGGQAAAWQAEERERLAHEIHENHGLTCDGGYARRGVAQLLPRQDVVGMFQRFFSKRDWALEE